jgi:hypothetical protein
VFAKCIVHQQYKIAFVSSPLSIIRFSFSIRYYRKVDRQSPVLSVVWFPAESSLFIWRPVSFHLSCSYIGQHLIENSLWSFRHVWISLRIYPFLILWILWRKHYHVTYEKLFIQSLISCRYISIKYCNPDVYYFNELLNSSQFHMTQEKFVIQKLVMYKHS